MAGEAAGDRHAGQTGKIDGHGVNVRQIHLHRVADFFAQFESGSWIGRPHNDVAVFERFGKVCRDQAADALSLQIIGIVVAMRQYISTDQNAPLDLEAGPMVVTQIKTVENDGYNAVQVGFVDKKEKKLTKALKGHFDKVEVGYKKVLREFPLKNGETFELGQEIKADLFAANDKVDVIGTSKGKGTQGAIKRITL